MRRLDLVVGPAGAGKSTFVGATLAPALPLSVVVDADEVAREHWPHDPTHHSNDAARIAAATRGRLIELGRSFIAETALPHPSALELIDGAVGAGFEVHLHVVLVPDHLAVARGRRRARTGGHHSHEERGHQRLWKLVAAAIERADTTTVYDNNALRGPRVVARMTGGFRIGAPAWPAWAPAELTSRWPAENGRPRA